MEAKEEGEVSALALLDIHTGDEVENLSHALKRMERDINGYIENLTHVTAEKERIGAELSVATHIQASMLPCIFPAFPNRREFDIYATMTPAKEVGGDFYDFFLVDDDHLAVVIADVSGKGVPAALFMVIAKTLIKDHTQSGKPPEEVFTEVNRQLCEANDENLFVTAWMGVLEISTGKLVYVHGYGGSGVCWQMTPDGREGFATLMLRRGWSSYVMDLPGRGRAGRTSATSAIKPVADEMFWFDIWRIGIWPDYNEGVQFPKDSVSLSQFFREMTPDISDHKQDVPVLGALAKRIGDHILVTHSAGGFPGWMSAMLNPEVKAVVSYEPGGFVFPEGEVPEPIDGRTGGAAGIPVSPEQFKRLTEIPIVLYFGDYIPETPTKNPGVCRRRGPCRTRRIYQAGHIGRTS